MPTVTINDVVTEAKVADNKPYRGNLSAVKNKYEGSNSISANVRYLNKNYYEYLASTSQVSTNANMKGVAYLLDTGIWNTNYKTSNADWAIGGPSFELLIKSYNEKHDHERLVGSIEANATYGKETINLRGYSYSETGGSTWQVGTFGSNESYDLYCKGSSNFLSNSNEVQGYYVCSPCLIDSNNNGTKLWVISLRNITSGAVDSTNFGFRPVVRLNSSVILEVDGDNYKIKGID